MRAAGVWFNIPIKTVGRFRLSPEWCGYLALPKNLAFSPQLTFWIPAFAGMTVGGIPAWREYGREIPAFAGMVRFLVFGFDFGGRFCIRHVIPAKAGI